MQIIYENVKAVIFDFDGTLYDNYGVPIHLIFSKPWYMFRMRTERVVRKKLKGYYAENEESFFKHYFSFWAKKSIASSSKLEKWYKNLYLPLLVKNLKKHYSAYEKVTELFSLLKTNGIKFSIVSDYGRLRERVDAVGIDSSATEHIYSSQELGGLKPAKEIFLKVAEKLGESPENILVVGDRFDTDGIGARECGMNFVRIRNKKNRDIQHNGDYPFLEWNDFVNQVFQTAT